MRQKNPLAAPPRSVPLTVYVRLLLGGFVTQFGWCFLGIGMVGVLVLGLECDPLAGFDFSGELTNVEGKVTSSEETNMSEGGGKHSRGTPIYLNGYEFEFEGKSYSGKSYAVGQRLDAGRQVTIEFPAGRPERSRIEGMRTAPFGPFVLFTGLFPLLGFGFVASGMVGGIRSLRLLRHGMPGEGVLVGREPTSTRINGRPVFRMTFQFEADDGQTYQAIANTHVTETLQDDPREPLLYDPVNPSRATLLDHLPGAPRVDEMGNIQLATPMVTLLVMIIPTLSVTVTGIIIYFRFLA